MAGGSGSCLQMPRASRSSGRLVDHPAQGNALLWEEEHFISNMVDTTLTKVGRCLIEKVRILDISRIWYMKRSRTRKLPASGPAPANMPMTTSAMEAALPQPRRRPRPEGGGGGAAKCGWPRALADAPAPLRARQLSQSGAGSAWAHISIASSSSMRCARAWSALSASNSARLIRQHMQAIMDYHSDASALHAHPGHNDRAQGCGPMMSTHGSKFKLTWQALLKLKRQKQKVCKKRWAPLRIEVVHSIGCIIRIFLRIMPALRPCTRAVHACSALCGSSTRQSHRPARWRQHPAASTTMRPGNITAVNHHHPGC